MKKLLSLLLSLVLLASLPLSLAGAEEEQVLNLFT